MALSRLYPEKKEMLRGRNGVDVARIIPYAVQRISDSIWISITDGTRYSLIN
jgi:hypothetical protein